VPSPVIEIPLAKLKAISFLITFCVFFIPKAYNNSVKIHKLLMLMVDGLVLFKKRGFKNGIKKIM
jgi:hypothetical protein